MKKFPLFIIIVLLLFGLFKWVGTNTEKIFLVKFIYSPRKRNILTAGLVADYFADKTYPSDQEGPRLYSASKYNEFMGCDKKKIGVYEEEIVDDLRNGRSLYKYIWSKCSDRERYLLYDYAEDGLINYKNTREIIELLEKGVLVVESERLRIFSPGFRAFILYEVDNESIVKLQKKFRENSTWKSIQIPLLILLLGIAVLVFFTQQGVFDKLLVLAGGISTLLTLILRFFGGQLNSAEKKS